MPSSDDPVVRARHLQEWLEAVQQEDEPWRARFFAGLGAESKAFIEGAARVAWLPASLHVKLADELAAAFGPKRTHAYYRRQFAAALRGPVLGPLFRTGVAVLGVTPATALRWSYKGWEASFRNCGAMRGEVLGAAEGRLVLEGLPLFFCASDAWLDSIQASTYGVYDFLAFDGIVRVNKEGRAEGRAQFELEWRARAKT